MSSTAVRRLPVALIACMILAGAAIWMTAAAPAGASAGFAPGLTQVERPAEKVASADSAAYTVAASPKRATKIEKPKPKPKKVARPAPVKRAATSKAPAKRAKATSGSTAKSSTSKKSKASDLARAQSILRSYVRKYPILKGSTVSFGDARGHQAICFYGSGRIVISKTHKASLERIIAHEVWHIIDWRDNGKINWGESIPPKNASTYVGK